MSSETTLSREHKKRRRKKKKFSKVDQYARCERVAQCPLHTPHVNGGAGLVSSSALPSSAPCQDEGRSALEARGTQVNGAFVSSFSFFDETRAFVPFRLEVGGCLARRAHRRAPWIVSRTERPAGNASELVRNDVRRKFF